jgi:predicted MPP superfamily phosphohydrolase
MHLKIDANNEYRIM